VVEIEWIIENLLDKFPLLDIEISA